MSESLLFFSLLLLQEEISFDFWDHDFFSKLHEFTLFAYAFECSVDELIGFSLSLSNFGFYGHTH